MNKPHDRRTFHRMSTATWGSLLVGCGTDQRELELLENQESGAGGNGTGGRPGVAPSAGGGSSGGSGGQGDGGSSGGLGGAPFTCGELTLSDIEGPFFLAGSPRQTDLKKDLPGTPLALSGIVRDADCSPIEGAIVDFWHADEAGAYDVEGPTFRGHQVTPSTGTFSLSTIVPGRYLNGSQYRPAHLHVKVTSGSMTLTTQLYFPNDPYNEVDAFFKPELLMTTTEGAGGITLATFDFYVPRG